MMCIIAFTTGLGVPLRLVASGAGSGFAAPHAVIDNIGRIYMAYVSDDAAPADISYMVYNGAIWGSYETGGFTSGTPDPVTTAAGFAADGGGRGEAFPLPQIALVDQSVWIFWAGTGTETYGIDQAELALQPHKFARRQLHRRCRHRHHHG